MLNCWKWTDSVSRSLRLILPSAVIGLVLVARPMALRGEEPPVTLPLHGNTRVQFATVADGKRALARKDRFLSSLSLFDKQSRLQTDQPVNEEKFVKFVTDEVRDWNEQEIEQIRPAIASIRQRMQSYQLPFPQTILLVKTTGREEGGAAYCRQNAIVLPEPLLRRIGRRLENLLIHELFHVLSSHNLSLRDKLYKIVGFKPCPRVPFPASLKDRRLTNPDAPVVDHLIQIERDGKKEDVVPVLYASIPRYDPKKGGTFFRYVVFKLMIVERSKNKPDQLTARLNDGEPILLEPQKEASFMEQIGANTGYIYHPDEILADNFVLLLMETKDLKTPRIIEEMRKILRKTGA